MEIVVLKYTEMDKPPESNEYSILDYKMLTGNTDLLLMEQSSTDIGATDKGDIFQIFKVQFIASCKIEIANNVIVAFYIGEDGALYPHVMRGLPDKHIQEESKLLCLDYKSYLETCEYTGETKLSLIDYAKKVEGGDRGINSMMIYNEKTYNYDEQQELWKKLDESVSVK